MQGVRPAADFYSHTASRRMDAAILSAECTGICGGKKKLPATVFSFSLELLFAGYGVAGALSGFDYGVGVFVEGCAYL